MDGRANPLMDRKVVEARSLSFSLCLLLVSFQLSLFVSFCLLDFLSIHFSDDLSPSLSIYVSLRLYLSIAYYIYIYIYIIYIYISLSLPIFTYLSIHQSMSIYPIFFDLFVTHFTFLQDSARPPHFLTLTPSKRSNSVSRQLKMKNNGKSSITRTVS